MFGPLSAGTKLGRYEIRSKLGVGGMSKVYLAQDSNREMRRMSRNIDFSL